MRALDGGACLVIVKSSRDDTAQSTGQPGPKTNPISSLGKWRREKAGEHQYQQFVQEQKSGQSERSCSWCSSCETSSFSIKLSSTKGGEEKEKEKEERKCEEVTERWPEQVGPNLYIRWQINHARSAKQRAGENTSLRNSRLRFRIRLRIRFRLGHQIGRPKLARFGRRRSSGLLELMRFDPGWTKFSSASVVSSTRPVRLILEALAS